MTFYLYLFAGVIISITILALLYRLSGLFGVISKKQDQEIGNSGNYLNAISFVIFGILFLGGIFYYSFAEKDHYLQPVGSEIGEKIDSLFWTTTIFVALVFFITQALLFYFAYRYRYKKERKASFFPENNKLELVWTIVPAIVLSLLLFGGLTLWDEVMNLPDEDIREVEIVGQQFAWYPHYPGKNKRLGRYDYRLIDNTNNLGIDFTDEDAQDDFIPLELHMEVNKAYRLNIRSKDVIHSVSFPHFRMKMDAVPGIPTSYWIKPSKTTKEMREENPKKFKDYELVCQQICGKGHFSMRLRLVVETKEEYEDWLSKQKTFLTLNPDYALKQGNKENVVLNKN